MPGPLVRPHLPGADRLRGRLSKITRESSHRSRGMRPAHARRDLNWLLALPGQKRKLRPNIRDLRPEDEISYHIEIAAKLGLFCPGSARACQSLSIAPST